MAANGPSESPPEGGPPQGRSFAAVVSGGAAVAASDALGEVSTFRGEPALRLTKQDIAKLAEPFQNALVGRFAFTRPSMELIRKFITSLGLKGECAVGLLDQKHVLLRPALEEDYTRLFARRVWYVRSSPMSISKWSLEFKANQELAIAPVWVAFPELPLPFFQKQQLLRLAATLGRPLRVDAATSDLRRPSVARVLVELCISAPPVQRVWIGDDNYGFWQPVELEGLPEYCSYCSMFGHGVGSCFRKDPSLWPAATGQQQRRRYVPRVTSETGKMAATAGPQRFLQQPDAVGTQDTPLLREEEGEAALVVTKVGGTKGNGEDLMLLGTASPVPDLQQQQSTVVQDKPGLGEGEGDAALSATEAGDKTKDGGVVEWVGLSSTALALQAKQQQQDRGLLESNQVAVGGEHGRAVLQSEGMGEDECSHGSAGHLWIELQGGSRVGIEEEGSIRVTNQFAALGELEGESADEEQRDRSHGRPVSRGWKRDGPPRGRSVDSGKAVSVSIEELKAFQRVFNAKTKRVQGVGTALDSSTLIDGELCNDLEEDNTDTVLRRKRGRPRKGDTSMNVPLAQASYSLRSHVRSD